jgi:UDP-3-O-[3-hydroxymyristoyl] glucosamine N-acyltransferase
MKFPKSFLIAEIAEMLNKKFVGSPSNLVLGINEIHMVENGDITFVDHPKYYDKALNSAATTIIINKEVVCPEGKNLILSETPFDDYNFLCKKFRPFNPQHAFIHPSAQIGEGTILQPGVFIGENSIIGKNCILHSNVAIYNHCEIGDNVVIHANAVIGSEAFYFKKKETGYDKMYSCGKVIIADDVEIGACCTIDKGVSGNTIIGKGSKFDNQVHVGHDTHIGERCLFAAQVGIAGVVKIEDDVILWGQVGVQKDLTIGKGAIVLGQSGLSKSIEGGKVYLGSPVEEARKKWKEIALVRTLPSIIENLSTK